MCVGEDEGVGGCLQLSPPPPPLLGNDLVPLISYSPNKASWLGVGLRFANTLHGLLLRMLSGVHIYANPVIMWAMADKEWGEEDSDLHCFQASAM